MMQSIGLLSRNLIGFQWQDRAGATKECRKLVELWHIPNSIRYSPIYHATLATNVSP